MRCVEEAKKSSNREVGNLLGIDESCLRKWQKQEAEIKALLESGVEKFRLLGGGRRASSQVRIRPVTQNILDVYRDPNLQSPFINFQLWTKLRKNFLFVYDLGLQNIFPILDFAPFSHNEYLNFVQISEGKLFFVNFKPKQFVSDFDFYQCILSKIVRPKVDQFNKPHCNMIIEIREQIKICQKVFLADTFIIPCNLIFL